MSDLFAGTDEDVAAVERGERPPDAPHRTRRRRWPWVLLALGVLVVAVAGAAGLWVYRQVNPPGGPGEEVTLVIEHGTSTQAIGRLLEAEGVITDARIFRYYVRLRGGGASFQAGEYQFRRNAAMGDVVDVLSAGPVIRYERLTIPEGLTVAEIIERVDRVSFLSSERFAALLDAGEIRSRYQPDGLEGRTAYEGILFPDTYTLEERADEAALLQRMIAAFEGVVDSLGYDQAEERVGLTPYEVVIVASLIEHEALVDVDRDRIARVIYNRIAEGMRLDIDATVYYALGRRGGTLTRADLEVDSPYNTRRYLGIPPTPIAVPGRASLEAAINPAEGDWLFYVRTEESGEHSFSRDYNQFLRDRERCRQGGWC